MYSDKDIERLKQNAENIGRASANVIHSRILLEAQFPDSYVIKQIIKNLKDAEEQLNDIKYWEDIMIEYRVVTAHKLDRFNNTVNTMLSIGWKLQGGVSISKSGLSTVYAQAVVKEDK